MYYDLLCIYIVMSYNVSIMMIQSLSFHFIFHIITSNNHNHVPIFLALYTQTPRALAAILYKGPGEIYRGMGPVQKASCQPWGE